VDVDPTSIKGVLAPGPNQAGSVSGLELTGATVTVEYSNGVVQQGQMYRVPNSIYASQLVLKNVAIPTPTLQVLGVPATPAQVASLAQTVRVGGPAGASVQVLVLEGGLYLTGVPGGGYNLTPFLFNTAVAVREYSATVGAGGTVDVPIALSRTNADPSAGLCAITATFKQADGATGPLAPAVVLEAP